MTLTPPQRRLLLAMFHAHPRRMHRVGDLGERMPVLRALVRAGFAEHGKATWKNDWYWNGRLTAAGRREAKELDHFWTGPRTPDAQNIPPTRPSAMCTASYPDAGGALQVWRDGKWRFVFVGASGTTKTLAQLRRQAQHEPPGWYRWVIVTWSRTQRKGPWKPHFKWQSAPIHHSGRV